MEIDPNLDHEKMVSTENAGNSVGRPAVPLVGLILLAGILMIGAYFRFIGMNWDQDLHLHPDERFLTMVSSAVSSVKNVGQFFNTAQSTLNPNNVGYGFFVYGTFPLFIVRYAAELVDWTGYSQIHIVGRYLSGLVDLLSVLLVFLIALRLYRRYRLALMAAAFSAAAVLQIQLSHFYTVDTFTNFFAFLAFYFAVVILTDEGLVRQLQAWSSRLLEKDTVLQANQEESEPVINAMDAETDVDPTRVRTGRIWFLHLWSGIDAYILFGVALGMAMASKISAIPVPLLLPAAVAIRFFQAPRDQRERYGVLLVRNLAIAALVSVFVFRILQPYAFTGPGFFNVGINPKWLATLSELSSQSGGNVDFPPALQWARRPITFAWQNMVEWGMGLPLGLLAWAGFVWMGFRSIKSILGRVHLPQDWQIVNPERWPEWQQHALIWGWTLVYFSWQSMVFSRTMRYQLPVYPSLSIIAAWAIFTLWENRSRIGQLLNPTRVKVQRVISVMVAVAVLSATFAWAFAFTRIYTRPTSRLEASEWIYQNVPAAMNLHVDTGSGTYNQPIAFRQGLTVSKQQPWVVGFHPSTQGIFTAVQIGHVLDPVRGAETKTLIASISESIDSQNPLTLGMVTDTFAGSDDGRGKTYTVYFPEGLFLNAEKTYYLKIWPDTDGALLELAAPVGVTIETKTGQVIQPLADPVAAIHEGQPFDTTFVPVKTGLLKEIYFPMVVDWQLGPNSKTVTVSVKDAVSENGTVSVGQIQGTLTPAADPRGQGYTVILNPAVQLQPNRPYSLRLSVNGQGSIAFYGSTQAKESSWDDAIPYGVNGYSAFDYNTGLYADDLNFEMYWDDNAEKLVRFTDTLNRADYIFISSNRQWGTTTRVPERYPLTTYFYRNLLGCPAQKDILWCYSVAQPGMFAGQLGFQLVKTVQSEPTLGPITINTQFAEEAFTVYDHPKVLIFKKSADYNPSGVQKMLSSVDLARVVHLIPGDAAKYKDLMLPADRLAVQQAGGTWADLFNRAALFNQYPWLSAVLWYLVVSLLGLVMYPFVRLALRGLPDKGYPFARLTGMMALAYLVWLAGSFKIPFSRTTISIAALLILLVNAYLFLIQKDEILEELRTKKKYFITVEIIILAFFLLFLAIRLGNPDLWHPSKGGEKPMDFSYLNAVIKSTTFPPYDPWFAGGYINYYYYGFVVVGVMIKWLGIVPAIAYNIFLPTWFSFTAIGAFSVIWNLVDGSALADHITGTIQGIGDSISEALPESNLYGGLAGAIGILILGNLGTVRMIWQGIMRLNPGVNIDTATIFQKIPWTISGIIRLIGGARLPYGPGDWYWIPSRAIPGEPITEFPFFTFLYADPHAHMFALPMTVLGLGWAISILKGCWNWGLEQGRYKGLHFIASFAMAGMVIGALRPTNTWDLPTYLAIGAVAVLYTAVRYAPRPAHPWGDLPNWVKPLGIALLSAGLLALLSFGLYQPFADWYGQAYNSIDPWTGSHTPFWSYMTHWGLFLFVIFTWLFWETIDWMAKTPLSHAKRLQPYQPLIYGGLAGLLVAVAGLTYLKVEIAWVALPMAAWAAVLILRPNQPDTKRMVLFMVGTGLVLTLAVELIVLRGDIGRMNTVFKFYLQAWTLLSLSAAAAVVWLIPEVERIWRPGWRMGWQIALALMVFGAALFPVTATTDKIRDRMSDAAPHTLDGMKYMAYSQYSDSNHDMNLVQDYKAILWMQQNIKGSPVIVEANTPEYRWGTRYTIYTGLPGVVGWNWHQRQQRALGNEADQVVNRVDSVGSFYNTTIRSDVADFLKKYAVRYIVVGQLEKAVYDPVGIAKFDSWNGDLWEQVYHQGDTTIYQVTP
jgi:YYY domain-containing protein